MGSGFIPIPHGDAAHMVRRNRRLGIDRFCCSTWVGIWIDYRDGIALTRDLEQRYPDDFIPYAVLDPRKSDDVAADVRLMLDEYGWRGLKPYQPRQGLRYDSPLYDPWYARGNEVGAFVKLHQTAIGDTFYDEVEGMATRFPNLSLMLAHSGWTWEVARARAAFAKRFPQVYLDLTFTSVLHGVVEYFCDEGLEDRVLFTTDAPMRDPIPQFGWVVYARGFGGAAREDPGPQRPPDARPRRPARRRRTAPALRAFRGLCAARGRERRLMTLQHP